MKRRASFFLVVAAGLALAGGVLPARASVQHIWRLTSPDHGQTFAYGSEQSRVWVTRGDNRHLALLLTFTNDPFVDRTNPRQTDYFTFNFPGVTLGADGRTYSYRAPDGRRLPVAAKRSGFLGIEEIKLLPTSYLVVKKPHGKVEVTLVVQDHPFPADSD